MMPSSGLRLAGDEYAPWAGHQAGDTAEIARCLMSDGLLDFISITSGSIYTGHSPARSISTASFATCIWQQASKTCSRAAGFRPKAASSIPRWRQAAG